jgi:CP family cyanate transporter-like MFS transporter
MTRTAHRAGFLIALLFVAANLRPSITGVGPLLRSIQADLSLSAAMAGLLGSVPLLIFAGLAPLARLADRLGTERLLLGGLALLATGIVLRSSAGVGALFAGTALLATGIAIVNVLMPILVRQHYPDRVAAVTTAYATTMGCIAALASGVAVPLATVLPGGWRGSMASWAVLAALAALVWAPHLRASERAPPARVDHGTTAIWRRPTAWFVTGYMGCQSTVFYVAVSWFPALLRDAGFTPVSAGWLLTLFQAAALLAGLVVPALIRRHADQRGGAFAAGAISALGCLGLLFLPQAAAAWMVLLGLGAGPGLIFALSFMGLRAGSPRSAAALSLMAQGLGYAVASIGPVLFGAIHDASDGWNLALTFAAAVALCQGLCGLGAGRSIRI